MHCLSTLYVYYCNVDSAEAASVGSPSYHSRCPDLHSFFLLAFPTGLPHPSVQVLFYLLTYRTHWMTLHNKIGTLLLQSATHPVLGTKSSHGASAHRHTAFFDFRHPPNLRRLEENLRRHHGLLDTLAHFRFPKAFDSMSVKCCLSFPLATYFGPCIIIIIRLDPVKYWSIHSNLWCNLIERMTEWCTLVVNDVSLYADVDGDFGRRLADKIT